MKIIAVEGLDGSGKTTLITTLKKYLEERAGWEVRVRREPGGNPQAEYLRSSLKGLTPEKHNWSPNAQLMLMMAARDSLYKEFTLAENISNDNLCYILDRNFLSSLIYQVVAQGASRELYKVLVNSLPVTSRPDLTLICHNRSEKDLEQQLTNRVDEVDQLDRVAIENRSLLDRAYRDVDAGITFSPYFHWENDCSDWENIGNKFIALGGASTVLQFLID